MLPPSALQVDPSSQYEGTYVYFLLSGGDVHYIGCTSRLSKRLVDHRRLREFDDVWAMRVTDRVALLLELRYQRQFGLAPPRRTHRAASATLTKAQWAWLQNQPGSTAETIRRLIDAARICQKSRGGSVAVTSKRERGGRKPLAASARRLTVVFTSDQVAAIDRHRGYMTRSQLVRKITDEWRSRRRKRQ